MHIFNIEIADQLRLRRHGLGLNMDPNHTSHVMFMFMFMFMYTFIVWAINNICYKQNSMKMCHEYNS